MGVIAFYHGIQDTYADIDPETGMKKLLPFKLAFSKFVFSGTWVVNLYLSFLRQVLGIDSRSDNISILISILFVYIERFE